MRYVFFLILFSSLSVLSLAQGASGIVSSVEITGNKIVGQDKIVTQIKTRPGQEYNANVINDDIKRIYSLGYFEDIQVDTREDTQNQIKVIFIVIEKPVLKDVSIEGSRKIRAFVLLKTIDLKEGVFLEEIQLKEAQEAMIDLYIKKGFPHTDISYEILVDDMTNEASVIFNVVESGRLKIKKIFVRGNITFADKRIIKLMKTRPAWLFRAGFFKEATFEDDLERIKDFYKKEGFQDIGVNYHIESDEVQGLMYITINLDEGKRYLIGEVRLEGYEKISAETLRRALFLRSADIYSEEKVQMQLSKLQEVYFNVGYIFAQIRPLPLVNPDTGFVDVSFDITENELIYVRMINVKGNTKTKDKVIRRELRIKPNEAFDGEKLKRSRENLENLGFFESVDFDTESTGEADKQDLVVEVKETKTGSFSFGGGYSSVEAFIGFVELRQRNFDVFNFPYFTGAGQDVSLYVQTGSTTQDFTLSFTEPWMFDRPISLGFDIYMREHDRETDVGYGYNEDVQGGRIRTGKRFNDFLSGGASYTFETVDISQVSATATQALRDEEGENDISKLGLSLKYDRRDNYFSPREGYVVTNFFEIAGGGLGGDRDFTKSFISYSKYFPMFKKSVFEVKLRGGLARPFDDSETVPLFERFFAGGASTIRGYDERMVGPIDPITEDPLGGEALFVANFEYTYPIGEYLKVAGFFDTGNVWSSHSNFFSTSLFSSVGLGVRVKTPLGPVSVDYGWPLDLQPGEESKEGKFHFNISRGF